MPWPDKEIISTFIHQYYNDTVFIPKEINVSELPEDPDLYENHLSDIKGKRVSIIRPLRGDKAHLLELARQNAIKELKDRIASGAATNHLLKRLQIKLNLDHLPEKIECYDNSNSSGKEAVSGMVVFVNGLPDKSLYRKYKIKTVEEQDDYAYMKEVLTRRFSREKTDMPFPDMVMVDGGKGQLNIALSILSELGISSDVPVIGIAKKDENKGETTDKIFVPGRSNPIQFGKDMDLLLFLQRIRDEAHRFAVSYHRKRRSQKVVRSALDDIKGIGDKRKTMLLQKYEGISNIQKASLEELSGLPGMNLKVAINLKKHLKTLS